VPPCTDPCTDLVRMARLYVFDRVSLNIMRLKQLTLLTTIFAAAVMSVPSASAAPPVRRWMVILSEPSVVERYPGRIEKIRAVAAPYRQHLQQVQASLRAQIEGMHIRVTGGVQHVMNGLFVTATPAQAASLRTLAGVQSVAPLRQYHKADQLTLSNVQGAWSAAAIGGVSNAGAGLKIAIIDTGIDQTKPSFQDSSLTAPSGYPVCDVQSNCAFTSNKVIVARSYVSDIIDADVTDTSDPSAQDRPDDLSARDLDGHGSGVASVAAGVTVSFNGTTITGVAPKAFLGNYKVFGSDEVNPNGSGNILQAVDDAITDGMDIINLSLGSPATTGPLDTVCDGECDPLAVALEQAVEQAEVFVVAAAGNEGADGYQFNFGCSDPPCFSLPTFSTVGSPAYAPSVLAAGGIENDVTYIQSVDVKGSGVPSDLNQIQATESVDGPIPGSPLTAPLVDVTQAGDSDGLLCSPISPSTLANSLALVLRGSCDFSVKVTNAQNAGAVGVIFIDNGTGLAGWGAGPSTVIPAFLISQSDGANLKSYIDAHTGADATLDPDPVQVPASFLGYIGKSVAYFASRGPSTGTGALKPDVSAAATDFLLAVESYDPYGELFSYNGYGTADGTSFATPMLAGAAALVMQANPGLTPLQVKSALVNTGTLSGLVTSDGSAPASITEVGSGILQAQNAVLTTLQVVPSSVSFGFLTQGGELPAAVTLVFANSGTSAVTLAMSVTPSAGHSSSSAQVLVNNSSSPSITVAAGQTTTVSATLSGSVPSPGRYEGLITVTGALVPFTIPYMFIVGNNTPYDVIPLNATPPGYSSFDGPVGQPIPSDYGGGIEIQVIDQYGAPVQNAAVQWTVTGGNGSILTGVDNTSTSTDQYGVAYATPVLGSTPGAQEFTATVNAMALPFDGYARNVPAISAGGIVDGASFTGGKAVAPGSWISVFGSNMSDTTQGNSGIDTAFDKCALCSVVNQPLPMGIDGTAFSFDASSLSLPGRFNYVSPTQLNLQVPWELVGQTSAVVKVMVNYTYGAEYTLALAEYSPGIFVIDSTTQAAAALDQSNNVVSTSNPVAPGSVVQLFLNGLGPVSNTPADGAAAPSSPLAKTPTTPTITIGGQNATVQFSGLAPNYVSLYQVNFVVPQGTPSGLQAITCSIGGVTSKTAYLSVK
jgi:minor extracellular serine protease Vpr